MTEFDLAVEVRAELLGVTRHQVKKAVMRKIMLGESEDALEAVMNLELSDLNKKSPNNRG